MTEFTEAEEAFIDASVDVIKAGELLRQAEEAMIAAQEIAVPFGEALGLEPTPSNAARIRELLLESARRGGFDEDSPVIQELNAAHEAVIAEINLIDQLARLEAQAEADVLTEGVNPVI